MRIAIAAVFLLAATAAHAEVYNLQWDYPASPVPVPNGFKAYCGSTTGVYDPASVAAAASTARNMQVTTPAGSTKFCVVRAFDSYGESTNSNEVKLMPPAKPPAPTNLRATPQPPAAD